MLSGFDDKTAMAECRIAFCRPGTEPQIFCGQAAGTIVAPRGDSNFGWDPVFQPEGKDKTYAEMTAEEKNDGSHRQKAIEAFQNFMTTNPDWI
jgi:inosine triphosphate pyrophosphatase